MIPLLLAFALLAASPPPAVPDGPPDLGRFIVWAKGEGRVLLDLPSLGVPAGLYGPMQARALLASLGAGAKVLAVEEVPLPNIAGRLRLFTLRVASDPEGADRWLLAYFARAGEGASPGTGPHQLDGWTLVKMREAGGAR